MKKLILAIISIATIALACNKEKVVTSVTPVSGIKKTRAEGGDGKTVKCNRDLIVNVGSKNVSCPKPGNCCKKTTKGIIRCDCDRVASPLGGLVINYTNANGTVNTINYFSTQDYGLLFPDVDATIYNQIIEGSLHLYCLPWNDVTPAEAGDLPPLDNCKHIYALSSASQISDVQKSNIQFLWIL